MTVFNCVEVSQSCNSVHRSRHFCRVEMCENWPEAEDKGGSREGGQGTKKTACCSGNGTIDTC